MFQALITLPFLTFFAFFALYIPGSLLMKNIKLPKLLHYVTSCVVGTAMWGWQAWILGWLGIRQLTYLYIFISVILWLKTTRLHIDKTTIINVFKSTLKEKQLIFLILLGLIIQLPAAWFFGLIDNNGFSLTSSMPPDLEWHASLIHQITQSIPPNQPAMYGVIVKNYHYFGDMVIGEFVRVFHVQLITTTFQFFSILLSIFLGLSAAVFTRTYKLNRTFEAVLIFLLYLGGDLNPFIPFLLGKGFHFRMGAMESGADMLTNYPRVFATIFVFIALSLIKKWKDKQNITIEIILGLIISAAVGSKVNTGFLPVVGIGVLGFYYLFKKQLRPLVLLIIIGLFTAGIFLPVNKNAGGLVYTGFWRAQDYIVHPELGLSHLELARQVLAQHNDVLRVLQYNLLFLSLYIVATFGTKLFTFIQTRDSLKQLPLFLHIVLISGMFACFVFGMFFIQSAGGANSFNFLSTVFIFSSIYAALSITYVLSNIPITFLKYSLLLLILLFTSTRSVHISWQLYTSYFGNNRPVTPTEELNVYDYIKDEIPSSATFLKGDYPLSYLGRKNIYFAEGNSLVVLQSHGIDTKKREELYKQLIKEGNVDQNVNKLKKLNISYAFMNADTTAISTLSSQIVDQIHIDDNTSIIKLK